MVERLEGKYFPWVLICSSDQNNVGWITFFLFSLDIALLSKRSLESQKRLLKRWLNFRRRQPYKKILARYQLNDIFNADEFGLFYEVLPSKSLHFRSKRSSGGKHFKVRLTGMAASNALGEKILMFVIRKSASPWCFKHVRNLPCRYRSQKKVWVDRTPFEWLRELDRKFEMRGGKVAMIVNNCPAHLEVSGLKAINLQFLPPNTTSGTQLMAGG